jgi:hypothetical protein
MRGYKCTSEHPSHSLPPHTPVVKCKPVLENDLAPRSPSCPSFSLPSSLPPSLPSFLPSFPPAMRPLLLPLRSLSAFLSTLPRTNDGHPALAPFSVRSFPLLGWHIGVVVSHPQPCLLCEGLRGGRRDGERGMGTSDTRSAS